MKKLLPILLVVVLAGAGAGGWFMFAGDADGEAAVVSTPKPSFVPLKPISANVIDGNRIVGRLTAELTLEVAGASGRAAVRENIRQLRDSYMAELHAMLDHEMANGPKVDIDLIKHRLLGASTRQLGPDLVLDVLIQTIVRRGERPGDRRRRSTSG